MVAPTRILIVGGAGFIGSHLVRRCVADGHRVHVVARPTSDISRLAEFGSAIVCHRLPLKDDDALRVCFEEARPTHVFHLAGDTGSRHDSSCVQAQRSVGGLESLIALVNAAAKASEPPRFILRTGSIAEYGAEPLPFSEDQPERPLTGYAASLVAGSHYARMLAPDLPFELVTARLALVYGPGQTGNFLIPSMISALAEGRPAIVERPLDRRDIVHVHDIVDALLALADASGSLPPVINIGSGQAVSVGFIAETIAAVLGADPALIRRRWQSGSTTHRLDTRRMFEATGWMPRIGLVDGLKTMVAAVTRKALSA
jgi:nucleoside-diphosphate-sugar epimerase